MKKNILFVDDEKQILRAIKRLFLSENYNVFLAESGKDALEILKNNHISIMVTDMRMPGMGGYELLQTVKALYPETLRLILSGYADENQIFNAIQNNLAKLYMFKPWDNEKFVDMINQISNFEDLRQNKRILNIIDKIDVLPTLPERYNKFNKLVESDASIDKISDFIEEDPSISASVLHIANSAFYASKVGSIKQAISFLGLANIKNIVLFTNVFNISGNFEIFKVKELWEHLAITNKIQHLIYSKLLNKKMPEYFSTAGLLHDIGKILEMQYFNTEYKKIIATAKTNKDKSIVEIENEILNINHCEFGAHLLDWWGVPHPIIEAALYHHDPLNENVLNKELICVVYVADYYSWKVLNNKISEPFKEETLKFINITHEDCEALIKELS